MSLLIQIIEKCLSPDNVIRKNAEQELITQIATELNVSEKCAIYFINRHFNVTLRVNTPDRMDETPTFNIVAEPKTVEEILNRSDDDKLNMECEKQLLEKH